MEHPHVVEGTSTGDGGWGSATGNNSRSNSGWFGIDPVSKSVNALTADLLGDGLNANSTSGNAPAECGGPQLPALMGEALPAETQGEGTPQEEVLTREHITVKTHVPVVADAAAAGPTTAGDSPEGGEGGGGSGGGGGEGGEKVADDGWGFSVKTKKKKRVGIPVIHSAGGGGDDWATAILKTKKKKKGVGIPVIHGAGGGTDDWATVSVKTKRGMNVGTPVIPSAGGGGDD